MQGKLAPRDPWPYLAVGSGLAFLVVAALVARLGRLGFDEPLAAAVRALPLPIESWEACTFLGGDILILIGGGLVLAALATRRYRLAAIIAVALIGAPLSTEAVKVMVARARPPDPLVVADGYGFPSGHTLNSTVTYGLLALVAWRARLELSVRRLAAAIGVAIPFLGGLSRIALGVHWPSDVLGGWLAGTALVAIAATLITLTAAMERQPVPSDGIAQPRAP
jgi:membrane-associated phospholipid phosphatase